MWNFRLYAEMRSLFVSFANWKTASELTRFGREQRYQILNTIILSANGGGASW